MSIMTDIKYYVAIGDTAGALLIAADLPATQRQDVERELGAVLCPCCHGAGDVASPAHEDATCCLRCQGAGIIARGEA